jgi:hypothetical protein
MPLIANSLHCDFLFFNRKIVKRKEHSWNNNIKLRIKSNIVKYNLLKL